ncbi:MAG: T9SS type A sorting domain-containing protein, partial [Bacteroidota bacterium]
GRFNQLFGYLLINGESAVVGEDYLAAFDSDGFCIGVGEITNIPAGTCPAGGPGYFFAVAGFNPNDGFCPNGYGANFGETYTVMVYDGSSQTYFDLPGEYEYVSGNNPSPTSLAFGCSFPDATSIILPAALTTFSGIAAGPKHVQLDWTVAQEENVAYYEVQRSRNGQDWSAIGSVVAMGDSETSLNYSYDDFTPEQSRQFYRLLMVDNDGAEEYSGIVIVELEASGLPTLQTFPNPATEASRLSIQLGGEWNEFAPVSAELFDVNGRVVAQYAGLGQGTSSVNLPAGISGGLYLLRVQQQDITLVQKVSIR